MATHGFNLTDSEESIYQAYLTQIGKTDVEVMAGLKSSLIEQVLQTINEIGANKFKGLSIADKISFFHQKL
jgi:hypothetical protein